jgi:hypothetical protein
VNDYDPLDELRPLCVMWHDSRIRLDVKAVALRTPPTLHTGVDLLYGDFFRWLLERDQAPPTPAQFLSLLKELGCQMHTAGGKLLVANVALKDAAEAQGAVLRNPPAPVKRHIAK